MMLLNLFFQVSWTYWWGIFIEKSKTNRIDTLTKYIFSSVTSLFSDDITENFIVLATFANKETTKKSAFTESIKTDADFLILKKI
jgi:hypothetical protein